MAGRRDEDRVELVDEMLQERGWLVWAGPSSTSPRTGRGPRVGPTRKGRAPAPDDAVRHQQLGVTSLPVSQGGAEGGAEPGGGGARIKWSASMGADATGMATGRVL